MKTYKYDKNNIQFIEERKSRSTDIFVLIFIILIIIAGCFIIFVQMNTMAHNIIEYVPYNDSISVDSIPITVTIYNPTIEQCGKDFMNTASMKRIPNDLSNIRWCAISRDLFFWHYNFFDTVEVYTGDYTIDGKYLITDVMGTKQTKSIDILSYKTTGKWNGYLLIKNYHD